MLKNNCPHSSSISYDECMRLCSGNFHLEELMERADKITRLHFKNTVSLCAIVNAKSGACSEDCRFCTQSSNSACGTPVYDLLDPEIILKKSLAARDDGASMFGIVTSGPSLSENQFETVLEAVRLIKRHAGIEPCASLGFLDASKASRLKDAGLYRYHHNLETSECFFPSICTTHAYRDKISTIIEAKNAGLKICSGGIFGLGETWADRIDMAFALKKLNVDSIPLNFFVPVKGTPLENLPLLSPHECLRIISIYRIILQEKEIKVCAGRATHFGELHDMIFKAGATSMMIGNYLTTAGRDVDEDRRMLASLGLETLEKGFTAEDAEG